MTIMMNHTLSIHSMQLVKRNESCTFIKRDMQNRSGQKSFSSYIKQEKESLIPILEEEPQKKPVQTEKNNDLTDKTDPIDPVDLTEFCTDENFASRLESESGESISMEKSINWTSKGSIALIKDQISYLRDNYNIESISVQAYYNLMADLTRMGVIAGTDCYKRTEDSIPCQGNLLKLTRARYDRIERTWNNISNGGNFTSTSKWMSFRDDVLAEKRSCERVLKVFELMKETEN